MEFADKSLVCRECSKSFLFTAGEQEFFRQKGLLNQPGRCPECRNRRKQEAAVTGIVPQHSQDGSPIPLRLRDVSTVVCAECGRETTVPFKPHLSRPVYCASCFTKQRELVQTAVATTPS